MSDNCENVENDCAQVCRAVDDNKYICECFPGFVLNGDQTTCSGRFPHFIFTHHISFQEERCLFGINQSGKSDLTA